MAESEDKFFTSATGGFSLMPENMTVTVEDTYALHAITEEQLDTVHRGGKDTSMGWCQALAGAALGLTQNLIDLVIDVFAGKTPARKDVLLALACAACAAGALAYFLSRRGTGTDVDGLVARIKGRKKKHQIGQKTAGEFFTKQG